MSLTKKTLLGAFLGIVFGVLFGRHSAFLSPIGTIYVMLMQAAVYPYLICSLLHGLGKMSTSISEGLFKRSWMGYVFIVIVIFLSLGLLVYALPVVRAPLIVYSTQSVNPLPELIHLTIPQNLFTALTLNYVPAVVVFCVIFGFMIHKVERNKSLLDVLETVSDTCIEFWRWLVNFAPYAFFALLATTIGSINLHQLQGLGIYLVLFYLGVIILTFWSIPSLLVSIAPLQYKPLMKEMRGAFLIAIATTLSVAALPIIRSYIYKLMDPKNIDKLTSKDVLDTSIAVSYPFAQLGNFFIYFFICFAAFYYGHYIQLNHSWTLPIVSWLSSIGSPSTTYNSVSFLAKWLNLPSSTTNLYLQLTALTRYGQVVLSVMGITFLAVIMTLGYTKRLQIRWNKLIINLLGLFFVLGVFAYVTKLVTPPPHLRKDNNYLYFTIPNKLKDNVNATIIPFDRADKVQGIQSSEDTLLRIKDTHVLRVGYNPKVMPYSYFNADHQLVGYDIVYAYRLAKDLHAKLILVPFEWKDLISDVKANKFDVAMSSIFLTEKRIQEISYAKYNHFTSMAFLVPRKEHRTFKSAKTIIKNKKQNIAVLDNIEKIHLLKEFLPDAHAVLVSDYSEALKLLKDNKVDAIFMPKAQARARAVLRPHYVAVSPQGIKNDISVGFVINNHSPLFLDYLNNWQAILVTDGFKEHVFNHWILGHPTVPQQEPPGLIPYFWKKFNAK